MKALKLAILIILYTALPASAYTAGFRLTDQYFRTRMIPVPFETCGAMIGVAAALWTVALISFIQALWTFKRRQSA